MVAGSNGGTVGVGNVSVTASGPTQRTEPPVSSASSVDASVAAGGSAPAPTAPVSNAPWITSASGPCSCASKVPSVTAIGESARQVSVSGVVGVVS